MNIKALVTTTNYETLSIKSTLLKHPHPCMKHDLVIKHNLRFRLYFRTEHITFKLKQSRNLQTLCMKIELNTNILTNLVYEIEDCWM